MLQCDIKQHFPSIDHALLRRILAHHIACNDTLWLIDRILASGVGVLSEEYEMAYFDNDDLGGWFKSLGGQPPQIDRS